MRHVTRRKALSVVALIVTLGVRSVYAVPSAAAAHLKAVECCAKHCPHGPHGLPADRCCHVTPSATDAATLTATASLQPAVLATDLPPAAVAMRGAWRVRPAPMAWDAGRHRLFITLRSLRL